MDTFSHISSRTRGGALVTVMVLVFALSIIIASYLKLGVAEQKVNMGYNNMLKARDAMEAALENATGQLAYRWETQTSFTVNELAPPNNIALASEFTDIFNADANISYTMAAKAGVVEFGKVYVDPNDPSNENDPLKGKLVAVKSVDIVGKATVTDAARGLDSSAYGQVTFQVRDAPLFSHAVFYNMDLEFHPGPAMQMNGPVHTNGDVWVQAVKSLVFTGNLTATQEIYYGYMKNGFNGDGSVDVTQDGRVYVFNGSQDASGNDLYSSFTKGAPILTYSAAVASDGTSKDYDDFWDSNKAVSEYESDSAYNNWKDLSMNIWGGNVQTEDHDVPVLNPIGYNDYVRDDPTTAAVDDDLNYAYALIEPNIPARDPSNSAQRNRFNKGAGEKEKFAYKSGIITRVHASDLGTTIPANAVQLKSKDTSANSNYWVSFHKINRTDPFDNASAVTTDYTLNDVDDETGALLYNDDSSVKTVDISEVQELPVYVNAAELATFHSIFFAHSYAEDGDGEPTESFRDPRRATTKNGNTDEGKLDIVEIDVGQLKTVLEAADGGGLWTGSATAAENFVPEDEFNGVMYVEFPIDPNYHTDTRKDAIVPSVKAPGRTFIDEDGDNVAAETGLLLTNASSIPNPAYNDGVAGRDAGFTLATNTALYVKGNYNADGDAATGSSTSSDDPDNPDPPAALIADAIHPLSNNFTFSETKNDTKNDRVATFTEFNAAMVQGLLPTLKEGQGWISGGNHNFPRFLEKWSNIEFRYRGSMVALYESEIATQGTDTTFYSPPIRNWGFFDEFEGGNYPPGTPNLRSYRKINFRFLSETEYNAALGALPF